MNDKRNKMLNVKSNEKELAEFKKRADEKHLSVSAYIRLMCLGK